MPQFKQGDPVRTKGGGPIMAVDTYASSGEVVCTYWVKSVRKQENVVEATIEAISPEQAKPKASMGWCGKSRQ